MSLNSTPSAERIHIGFFGKRNAGKSSLINTITNQDISIVSDIKGTTTDPVYKAIELLPIGPVSIIDTAGFDDVGEIGELRIEKTKQILNKIDIAILVVDAVEGITPDDKKFELILKDKKINYIIVFNKCDLVQEYKNTKDEIYVSAKSKINIEQLIETIVSKYDKKTNKQELIKDLINPSDIVILVTPIDSSAPKGRLILPQQQVIRDLLETQAITIIVQVDELKKTLNNLKQFPKLIITDSQVFKTVNEILPKNIPLTSFSILFARYKGILKTAVNGVLALENLSDGDTILISEGCTHHRQCEDIGTVKLPNWIKTYTNKSIKFEFTSGNTFPSELSKYKMIIHCGGCMLKQQEVLNRFNLAKEQNIPITNYGITIAHINGILRRSIELFDIY